MTFWKVSCLENKFPGMWQRWYKNQCVGIGWPPEDWTLDGSTQNRGWSRARQALKEIEIGDYLIVTLKNHRVGRIGRVTGKHIVDSEWDPLVPKSREWPIGEMGRRINVRWDLTVGPDSRDMVVALPEKCRFSIGELRPTISRIRSQSPETIVDAMKDSENWVGLLTHFDYERALSGYIAAYPHRLEDGLLPHPNDRVRERVFGDRSRLDVLLTDRDERPVIVECKQGSPTIDHLKQIRRYMRLLHKETGTSPRGILIHGGSKKLRPEIIAAANSKPEVEIVQYSLDVDFAKSI